MSTVAELKQQVEALEATLATVVMSTVDGITTMAAGLQFKVNQNGGCMDDTGVSHPDEKGTSIKLGDIYWRVMGTMQIGKVTQTIGLHIKKHDKKGNLKLMPQPNQVITLPANVKLHRTSGSRWELYQGDKHPDEEFNIDPQSRNRRGFNPHTAGATSTAGVWD